VDVPLDAWLQELQARGLPAHLQHHLGTLAKLHAADAFDRTSSVTEEILGRPATSIRDFVAAHADVFTPRNK
jgi:hypothetical protein